MGGVGIMPHRSMEFWLNDEFEGLIKRIHYTSPENESVHPTLIVELVDKNPFYYLQGGYEVEYDEDGWASRLMVHEKLIETDILPTPRALKDVVPGLLEMVKCPVCTKENERDGRETPLDIALWNVIIHLNDEHKKSREYVADWLETLDIDLTFKEVEHDNDNSRDEWEFHSYEHPPD